MSAIDGRFDSRQTLKNEGSYVLVGGPLGDSDGLAVKVHVVVVDQQGTVAEGEGVRVGNLTTWSGTAANQAGAQLQAGKAIAYAAAVGTGPDGISTYQWHTVVDLVADGTSPPAAVPA